MGNKGGGNQYDFFIQQEEFKLQIILCSVADIKGVKIIFFNILI